MAGRRISALMRIALMAKIFGAVSLTAAMAQDADPLLAYPEDYRDWRHVKTEYWGETHALYDAVGGLHHIYANEQAMKGLQQGHYEDGAAFAFDLFDVTDEEGALKESIRKALFIMVRDEAKFSETGGWGYEGYGGDDRVTRLVKDQAGTMCVTCHLSKADSQYVFEDGLRK